MIRPQLLILISEITPTAAIGDTLCAYLRQWADAWNAKTAELKEQVRLRTRETLNRLGVYFAQAWRAGKATTFSFHITKTFMTGELHPKTRAGEQERYCSLRTTFNHIDRLVSVGILAKESKQEDTKYRFEGGRKAISCLRLTWGAEIIALFRQEDTFALPADAPLTYAAEKQALENFLSSGILKNIRT